MPIVKCRLCDAEHVSLQLLLPTTCHMDVQLIDDDLHRNSKVSFCISGLYLLQLNQSQLLLGLSHNQLHIYALITLISFKYLELVCRLDHLIWKMENRLCYAFFGGLYADLSKFFKRQTFNRKLD